jgi:hypothetical protein
MSWKPHLPRLLPSGRVKYVLGLPGCFIPVVVPEVIDAWEFIADFRSFVEHWRPMRLRTGPQQVATRALFEQWERLGVAAVDPERWKAILPPRPHFYNPWKSAT